ncbi:MAG: adenosylcobalamin-dependent ribonucleoside-diphosphate reductase [Bacteroidetes bacterium]|nr:adenosylcobalamin-dependent ribonucleoside-diphosphate reductase [Bacteroidota bacterium]
MKKNLINSDISSFIWDLKYRLKTFSGEPLEQSVEETWDRIAGAVSIREKDHTYWKNIFYNSFTDFKLIPGGRISVGAGTDKDLTLINTFVMGVIPDNLIGIFENLKESALTMSLGGGIGCDFSTIRPDTSEIKGVNSPSCGPLPFMDVWDQMCETITSGGVRRGAMMAMLRCDHPDIQQFITAKQQSNKLSRFNLSVLITDKFIEAINSDLDWDLVFDNKIFRTVRARELWEELMHMSYEHAEPGVLFIDVMNRCNNLQYCETILGTNSCGEQLLPPYGSCPLASINLTQLIVTPFQKSAKLNIDEFESLIYIGIRMLDNVLDISKYPLEAQKTEALKKRRVGLGITGLADALAMCNVRYGSKEALSLTEEWMKTFQRCSYLASTDLAKERGAFPCYDDRFLEGPQAFMLGQDIRNSIAANKLRNGALNSIPPAGTTSLYAHNISSGIEPIFSLAAKRKIKLNNNDIKVIEVNDYAFELYKINGNTIGITPDFFITSNELSVSEHVQMQSMAQKYIDSSISKTINCPKDINFMDFKDVFLNAYNSGCKGCTVYRPNEIRTHVLSS